MVPNDSPRKQPNDCERIDAAFLRIGKALDAKVPQALTPEQQLALQQDVCCIQQRSTPARDFICELQEKIHTYIQGNYQGGDNRLAFLVLMVGDPKLLRFYAEKRLAYLLAQKAYTAIREEALFKYAPTILQGAVRHALLMHMQQQSASITMWPDEFIACIKTFLGQNDTEMATYLDLLCYRAVLKCEKLETEKTILALMQKCAWPITKEGAELFIDFLYKNLDRFSDAFYTTLLKMGSQELSQVIAYKKLSGALRDPNAAKAYRSAYTPGHLADTIGPFDADTKVRIINLLADVLKLGPEKHSGAILALIEDVLHAIYGTANASELHQSLENAKTAYQNHHVYLGRLEALKAAFAKGEPHEVVGLLKDCLARTERHKNNDATHTASIDKAMQDFLLFLKTNVFAAGMRAPQDTQALGRIQTLYIAIVDCSPPLNFSESVATVWAALGILHKAIDTKGRFMPGALLDVGLGALGTALLKGTCKDALLNVLEAFDFSQAVFDAIGLLPEEHYKRLMANLTAQLEKKTLSNPLAHLLQRFKESIEKKQFDAELAAQFAVLKQALQHIFATGPLDVTLINKLQATPYIGAEYKAFWQAVLKDVRVLDAGKANALGKLLLNPDEVAEVNLIESADALAVMTEKGLKGEIKPEEVPAVVVRLLKYYETCPRLRTALIGLKCRCLMEFQTQLLAPAQAKKQLQLDTKTLHQLVFCVQCVLALWGQGDLGNSAPDALMHTYLLYLSGLHAFFTAKLLPQAAPSSSVNLLLGNGLFGRPNSACLAQRLAVFLQQSTLENFPEAVGAFVVTWREVHKRAKNGQQGGVCNIEAQLVQIEKDALRLKAIQQHCATKRCVKT